MINMIGSSSGSRSSSSSSRCRSRERVGFERREQLAVSPQQVVH